MLANARSASLSAFVLAPGGSTCRALEAAARAGAAVSVTLCGDPVGAGGRAQDGVDRINGRAAADLRAAGVRVRFASGLPKMHLKAAVVDGVGYLDDRNWAQGDRPLRARDPNTVAAIASAIDGRAAASPALATEKHDALAREAALIRASRGAVDCVSETFGATGVEAALEERASAGERVRVVVAEDAARTSPAERAAIARMEAAGVDVRAGRAADKACIAGGAAWLGSANASPSPPTLDWGLTTCDPRLVASAAEIFERDWARARDLSA